MKIHKNRAKVKVSKLNHNPLFVNFLNWKGDLYSIHKILDSLSGTFESEKDRDIVLDRLNRLDNPYLDNLTSFQKVFKGYMKQTIVVSKISPEFMAWMGNAFKYIKENVSQYAQDESRSVSIIDSEGRWFEGIIIYNFIMTYNYFGSDIIKLCPVCSSFFCHKGKYAKYCGEGCKETGMKK